MRALFLVTVDCDLRSPDVAVREAALHALLDAFDECGVAGHVTWFLNENDFAITANHEAFLREALERGDTIGVHDHVDFMRGEFPVDEVEAYCGRSKAGVERWLAAHGRDEPVACHRMGCQVQRPSVYEALGRLGYSVVSDVWPGHARRGHADFQAFDNRDLPTGIGAYRHDAANFADHGSTEGRFVHIPVMHMGLATRMYHTLDHEAVGRWLEESMRGGVEPAVVTWLFHPYEIMTGERAADRGGIDAGRLETLRSHLRWAGDDRRLELASMAACAREVGDG